MNIDIHCTIGKLAIKESEVEYQNCGKTKRERSKKANVKTKKIGKLRKCCSARWLMKDAMKAKEDIKQKQPS